MDNTCDKSIEVLKHDVSREMVEPSQSRNKPDSNNSAQSLHHLRTVEPADQPARIREAKRIDSILQLIIWGPYV